MSANLTITETTGHRFIVARCTAFTLTHGMIVGKTNSGGHGTFAVPFVDVAAKFAESANRQDCERLIELFKVRLERIES